MESELAGITAGNGAIYAVRRSAYEELPPSGSHDLSFPFRLAKRGLRSLYAPGARAEEKMVPTIEGEFARKRRMMVGLWDIVVGEGMLIPRGYPPLFAFELFTHRLLRYATPFLHVLVLLANLVLLGTGWFYYLTLIAQLALLGVAALSNRLPDDAVVRICRYYVLTQASIVLGLWDRLRHGSGGRWEKAAGRVRSAADAARRRQAPRRARAPRPLPGPARLRRSGSSSTAAARSSTASCGSARASRAFEMLKLRTMKQGSDPVGVGTAVGRGDPRVTRPGELDAPHLARRDPQPGQRPARRDGDRRPAPGPARPPRPLSTSTATPASTSSPGSPAGPRSRAAPTSPGRNGSSSTTGTSSTAAPVLDLRILAMTIRLVLTGQGVAPD